MALNPSKNSSSRTPFDDALVDDPQSPRDTQPLTPRPAPAQTQAGRRLPPQVVPPSTQADDVQSAATGAAVMQAPHASHTPLSPHAVRRNTTLTRRLPTTTLVGLAMAGGALGVILISALVSRLTPRPNAAGLSPDDTPPAALRPVAPGYVARVPVEPGSAASSAAPPGTQTLKPPDGDADEPVASVAPDTHLRSPAPDAARGASPATRADERAPAARRSDAAGASGDRSSTRRSEGSSEGSLRAGREEHDADSDATVLPIPAGGGEGSVHNGRGYAITPPRGFKLVQSGRRTIWRGPGGAQILVETAPVGNRSPRRDWEKMDAALARKYGERYRSRGISDTNLAGREAAAWEFELDTRSGTTRKIDVAVHHRGRGYAVLGSAPAGRFEEVRPQLEAAIRSFEIRQAEPGSQSGQRRTSSRARRRESSRRETRRDESQSRDETTSDDGAPVRSEGY